jgi:serine/threonine-protein kinase
VTTVTTQVQTEPPPPTETEPATVTETETVITEPETVEVPDVTGQTQLEAGEAVQDAGLVPDTYPVPSELQRGSVVSQNPAPGTELEEGQVVRLNVSVGGGTRPSVQVPDVTGPEASDARLALWRAKLCVRSQSRAAPSQEEVGEVLTQQPSPGASVQQYTQVTIFVGT